MAERLSFDERKLIQELHEQGLKPVEIASEVSRVLGTKRRDNRTVKRYLARLPREQSVGLEKQHWELRHRNNIRRRIRKLENKLEIPSPLMLWVPDESRNRDTGESEETHPVTELGLDLVGDTIGWECNRRGWKVKLDAKFKPVEDHLKSSRFRAAWEELEFWKQRVGVYIEKCYRLRMYIEREAKDSCKLDLPSGIGQRGLPDGFCRSVFWATFSNEAVIKKDYQVVSERDGLNLLKYASFNLAWVKGSDMERLKWAHQRLVATCRNLSITMEINQAIAELRVIAESLRHRLEEFASLDILPGKCELC
jgi:hypothetical protein